MRLFGITIGVRLPAFLHQAPPPTRTVDVGSYGRWELVGETWRFRPAAEPPAFGEVEVCRGCGCTELRACPGGCWWVGRGMCSRCYGRGLA